MFRVGIFLDFVWLTTRTEGPHGAYVRGPDEIGLTPMGGGIERLATRTCIPLVYLPARKSGEMFRVGVFS